MVIGKVGCLYSADKNTVRIFLAALSELLHRRPFLAPLFTSSMGSDKFRYVPHFVATCGRLRECVFRATLSFCSLLYRAAEYQPQNLHH